MTNTEKIQVSCYSMKMQIYPSPAQKAALDKIFRALQIAYNMTFHEVFQKNPMVCTEPNKDGAVWPDYRKMAKSEWRQILIAKNSAIADAPAAALTTNKGLFLLDGKRAWQTGMNNRPIDMAQRQDFRFYNSNKPRRSFMVQLSAQNIVPSLDNPKVAWISIPKVEGKVKARGFNHKVWFGENGMHTYTEALKANELAKNLTVRFSKDTCGDYFVSVTISDGQKHDRLIFLETAERSAPIPIGIDVGIKDVAITSDGDKVPNVHFKKQRDSSLRKLNRQLSRRWGPANMAYRDYNKELRKENRENPEEPPQPLAQPSNRYKATQQKKARMERKIARRRDTYYHQQTAALVNKSSTIAVETLHVKNMLRNHKLAYALSDAAMSDFISKVEYKAERFGVPVIPIGMFEPSSQLCSVCGALYPAAKNLSIREWTCPECRTRHDRDINAAKNILAIALKTGGGVDTELSPKPKPAAQRKPPGARTRNAVLPDNPEIVVVFSKELTRPNNPRYIIINKQTKQVIDDAQGAGFRSISNARNCYKAKKKWAEKLSNFAQ